MPDTLNGNLFPIAEILRRRSRFIILITFASAIAAAGIYLLKPKIYVAEIVFILRNPLYADRNYVYNNDMKFIDYYASEDDITRFITMSWTDSLQDKMIREMELAKVYDLDMSKPEEALKLKQIFARNLGIHRSEDKNVVITYSDTSQERAIKITAKTLDELELALRSYYIDMRNDMRNAILNTIHEEDSAIAVFTDSLVQLRETYGIYDIISPSRGNLVLPAIKPSGKPDFARGLEVIQNVESVKDQLVNDKARHLSLVNQYATGQSIKEMPLVRIVNATKIPLKKKGVGGVTVVVTAAFFGFFFSMLFVLLMGFYKMVRTRSAHESNNA